MMMCTSSTPWPASMSQHDLENRLANVRRRHRRQRQADVVNCDRHSHSRLELSEEWIASVRMIQRVANRGFAIRQTFDRRVGIQHPRSDREIFENEVLTGRHDSRRAVAIDVDNGFVRFLS